MVEVSLFELKDYDPQLIQFLLFEGMVVWGTELGRLGTELWSNFVRSHHGLPPLGGLSGGDGSFSEWNALPSTLWTGIVNHLSANDLPSLILALPLNAMSWEEELDNRFPYSAGNGQPQLQDPSVTAQTRMRALQSACQLMSVLSAVRIAAPLLRWPGAFLPAPSATTISSPGLGLLSATELASPPASPDLGPGWEGWGPPPALTAELPSPLVGPAADPVIPENPSNCTATNTADYVCNGLLEVSAALPAPRKLPLPGKAAPHSLSSEDALLVVMTCDQGECRAIRRSDLRQVSSFKVKDGSCLDFSGDQLLIGTATPARLLAYDLLEPKPRNPKCKLNLVSTKAAAPKDCGVAQVAFVQGGSQCCVCGLYSKPVGAYSHVLCTPISEVVIVDCRGESLTTFRRLSATLEGYSDVRVFAGFGSDRIITGSFDRELILWSGVSGETAACSGMKLPPVDCNVKEDTRTANSPDRSDTAAVTDDDDSDSDSDNGQVSDAARSRRPSAQSCWQMPMLAADVRSEWIAAVPGDEKCVELKALTVRREATSAGSKEKLADVWKSFSLETCSGLQRQQNNAEAEWKVRLVYIHGPVLFAFVSLGKGLWPDRLFSWHLPSGRPLALGCRLPGAVTAITGTTRSSNVNAVSSEATAASLVFACHSSGARSDESFLLLPGVVTSQTCPKADTADGSRLRGRTNSGDSVGEAPEPKGPKKKTVRGSDIRQRGMRR
eukprot:TRINITY_DN17869_c0_g1_i1.p1 TRINITY_DN17869_c0_g1~~TRINITY_DN17869_c0_g1_i1.p1  ORF type:complete len:752 (+),score=104.32 TRINITY_DN17869_c0_g1_i1:86-2257(+)